MSTFNDNKNSIAVIKTCHNPCNNKFNKGCKESLRNGFIGKGCSAWCVERKSPLPNTT